MVQHLLASGPALLTLSFFLIGVLNWPATKTWARTVTSVVVLALAVRYLIWRLTATVMPQPGDTILASAWIWFLFAVECLILIDVSVFMLTMSRSVDRTSEADRLETALHDAGAQALPTADVFIPTYNEPLSVLERTIVGALALDYPAKKLKIYVLDDGRRDWLRDFCETKGVNYITRPDNAHAKAGNLNNALKISSGEFIAIFDSDFVPYRRFLYRTLGFFADPTIGIVQTPQHFFNKDPVQSNLWLEALWPDEQRLFFDEMAASRDAWNVSFCCGSCAVLRREAIDAIGGIPTESVTEDLLTTLECLREGYITRYLNERLSMGLAAEDLKAFFIQRNRWCRGGIQTLFLRNGPLLAPHLTLFQRIMFVPWSWLIQYFVRFVALIAPPIFLLTGLAPLHLASVEDIIYYQVPVLLAYSLFMRWTAARAYLPIVSAAVGAFTTFRMLPVVIASVVKPFGVPFHVTPKGAPAGGQFDRYTFGWIVAILSATALGLFINLLPEWSPIGQKTSLNIVVTFWAALNILILALAAMICFDTPRAADGWFHTDEPARLNVQGKTFQARLVGVALDRSAVQVTGNVDLHVGQEAILEISGSDSFPVEISGTRLAKDVCRLSLSHKTLPQETRDQLIRKMYTGNYADEIDAVRSSRIFGGLWIRAFGSRRRLA